MQAIEFVASGEAIVEGADEGGRDPEAEETPGLDTVKRRREPSLPELLPGGLDARDKTFDPDPKLRAQVFEQAAAVLGKPEPPRLQVGTDVGVPVQGAAGAARVSRPRELGQAAGRGGQGREEADGVVPGLEPAKGAGHLEGIPSCDLVHTVAIQSGANAVRGCR